MRETFVVVLAPLIIARSGPRRKKPGWQPRLAGLTPPDPGLGTDIILEAPVALVCDGKACPNPPWSGGTPAGVPLRRYSAPRPGPATLPSRHLIAGQNVSYLLNRATSSPLH